MKKLAFIILFFCLLQPSIAQQDPKQVTGIETYADSVNNGIIKEDTRKPSVRREAIGEIGKSKIVIDYGSPGVRDRIIWGGLVPYDQVWVAGAHHSTRITFEADVLLDNQKIPAGSYGFFAIPGKKEWTLILNKNFDQHLADDYSEEQDVIRVKAKPQSIKEFIPRLTYTIESIKGSSQGEISLSWDKLKVSLPITSL